jgi:HD-GYP domain-containing protein (c-di-GMP phosphodiesterase class II)
MNSQVSLPEMLDRGRPRPTPGGMSESALDVLERFGQSLQQCTQSAQQIRLTLETVRASLGADAIYWDPGTSSDSVEAQGREIPGAQLGPAWYRQLTSQLLANEAGDPAYLLRGRLSPTVPIAPLPTSAALVRISRFHRSWLGAISFNPRRVFDASDVKVMLLARRMLLNHRRQAQSYEQLREALFGLVRCLTAAIDAKDPCTCGHSERVARIAVRLGRQMKLSQSMLSDLYLAGLLHDVGKIGIRDNVLLKTGPLTAEEWLHMQEHPVIGDRMLSAVGPLAHLRPGVRNHHERIDGKGYPDRLAGQDIPLLARVLAVADACDAMMAARLYRPALDPQRIDAIMAEGAGTQWDAGVIEHFLACREELYSICQRGLGSSVVEAVDDVVERMKLVEMSLRGNAG